MHESHVIRCREGRNILDLDLGLLAWQAINVRLDAKRPPAFDKALPSTLTSGEGGKGGPSEGGEGRCRDGWNLRFFSVQNEDSGRQR